MLPSLHHDGSPRYAQPEYPRLGDEITLRMRAHLDAPVQRVLLRTCPDGEQLFTEMQDEPYQAGDACRWWRVTLRLNMPVLHYRFMLFTSHGVFWYNAAGLRTYSPADRDDFIILADYSPPAWVREAVFYQIFPDRFANGDPGSDVRDGEYEYIGFPSRRRSWGEPPTTGSRADMVEFYGGDLPGITARLDYLADLGVNALYLNPVFSALSNHRYDVTDYENVDPHLGGNAALIELGKALRLRGMRYMLDIVPNHCGMAHPWFTQAQADPSAPTAEYFTFHHHPDGYESWLGVRTLPKLNYRSQKLRQVMYAGPQAIFRRWLQPPFAAHGWRIDVANMLARQGADQMGMEVGRGIRQAVKQENPQAYLLGENFFDATEQLQGDIWDAVMNYAGFSKPLWHWLDRVQVSMRGNPLPARAEQPWSTQAMVETWAALQAGIPWVVAQQQFNLIGSHDTPRIKTLLKGDMALVRLAVGLLFTYPGVPCVYYGDEIGLGNESGPTSRQCMPWDESAWDIDLRRFYQALIHLRRTSPALIKGGFQVLLAEADSLAFLRDSQEECLIVVAQRGQTARPEGALPVAHGGLPDGLEMQELFSGQRRRVEGGSLPLPELLPGVQVWQSRI